YSAPVIQPDRRRAMLIKICLAVAIAAGLFAAGLSFVKVKEKIATTLAERDQNAKDRDEERTQKQAAQKEAKTNKEGWDKTKEELTSTKDSLDKETAKATAQ